jgi:mannitol/fructose-specific phosphotransferase system IIA component (Ntr-type)
MVYAMFERQGLARDQIETIANEVLEREQVLSTGIGWGFAVPHGVTEILSGLHAGVFYAAEAIEWDSLDGVPVWVFFCVVGSRSSAGQHVKFMSRVSRAVRCSASWMPERPPTSPAEWEAIFVTTLNLRPV